MLVPEWIGLLMLAASSLIAIVICLYLIYLFTYLFFDYLLPWAFHMLRIYRVRNMNREEVQEYLKYISDEWTDIQEKKGKR